MKIRRRNDPTVPGRKSAAPPPGTKPHNRSRKRPASYQTKGKTNPRTIAGPGRHNPPRPIPGASPEQSEAFGYG